MAASHWSQYLHKLIWKTKGSISFAMHNMWWVFLIFCRVIFCINYLELLSPKYIYIQCSSVFKEDLCENVNLQPWLMSAQVLVLSLMPTEYIYYIYIFSPRCLSVTFHEGYLWKATRKKKQTGSRNSVIACVISHSDCRICVRREHLNFRALCWSLLGGRAILEDILAMRNSFIFLHQEDLWM